MVKDMLAYTITFPYKGIYREIVIDANYFANRFISIDADYDFVYDDDNFPELSFKYYDDKTKSFIDMAVEFNTGGTLNVAYSSNMDNDDLQGKYTEKNIPWLLLKVEDKTTLKTIYNVTTD